ncbi:polymorphic toxin-type HINT domain-containing protein [Streptacidiphilus sp. N1-3]|uniref:Polymorphic toxin-type HINT domain-containing protein n=1 Tax=Streptacidiphilus alkalitolerans TaxID=3342712 RepID=A0ABV6WTU5_9ACTN
MTAAIAVLALTTPLAVAQNIPGYHFTGKIWSPKTLPATPAVGSHKLTGTSGKQPKADKPLPRYQPTVPLWPAAGTSTVALTRPVPTSSGASTAPKSTAGASATASPSAWAPSGSPAPQAVAVTGPVKAGGLPVWVAPASAPKPGSRARSGASSPSQVRVQVASHAQTLAAGANGMLLGLARADGETGAAPVQVVIDYAALATAYGGGYGSRLQAFQVPACALTTPQLTACRTRTPLAFTNRAGADQLTGNLVLGTGSVSGSGVAPRSLAQGALAPMGSSASSSMTMVEISSGDAGSQGNFAATSLNPSGTWQTSATGAYTYSYPIDVPAAVGGNTPAVGLSYDSQSVDGETSARNSQASWVGDGWDYQPGFVERTYRSCGSLLDSSGNKILKGSGDQCWGGDNATVSFGSHSGVLVPVANATGQTNEIQQWKLQGDDGTIVQELTGASNGLYQGVYYRVLTTDGAAAYFGADHAPTGAGAAGSMQSSPADASTNSAWGTPVLHPVTGDPCYNSTAGKASQCSSSEGWRWNLDFTVSPTGFVQRYDYSAQSNYYDLGGGQVAASNGSGTLTKYTRGGALASISYGYQIADAIAGRTPAAQVVFTSKQRCQTTSDFDCTAAISDSNATHWPDVPYDLNCDSTDTTTLPSGSTTVPANVCITSAPTFWTTTRLDSITTKVNVAGTGLTKVDSYQLGQLYSDAGGVVDPITGTSIDPKDAGQLQAVMWLQQLTHTGYDASGSALTVNPVSFTGTEIDNRVNDSNPAAPPLYRPRISSIHTETGEQIGVEYNTTPCTGLTLSFSTADSNTHSCYPVYWAPPGQSLPVQDWFNKITVSQVFVSDLTISALYIPDTNKAVAAGSPAQESDYTYGAPAWHRDDSAQTDDQYRTWDQFRGFRTVSVRTGTAPDVITQQTTTYLQGMDGDYKADGTRRSIAVADSAGGSTTDSNWLAGTALETDTYTQAGGTVDAMTINNAPTLTQTASVPQSPWTDWNTTDNTGTAPALSTLPPLVSRRITASTGTTYALLADGTTWRQTKTTVSYDSNARVSTVDAQAKDDRLTGTATPLQESCATTTYAAPPSGNALMLSYPDQVTTVSGHCAAATSTTLLSDKQIYYDGDGTLAPLPAFGQLGITGRATATRIATGYSGSTEQWRTTGAMTYDGGGRITQTLTLDPTGAKPAGLATTTAFTPPWSSAGGNTNAVTVKSTNSQGWTTSSTLDPLRGLATQTVDANNRITDVTYDALGRRTAVWLPSRVAPLTSPKSAYPSAPDEVFSYQIAPGGTVSSPGAPSTVSTKTLRMDGTYSTSVSIYDGMLQPRQVQTPSAKSDNGRLISDTFYDSHGWPTVSYGTYSDANNPPSTTLFAANEDQIPSETSTSYDGQGRATASTLWHYALPQWQSTTSYPGVDQTTSTSPAGGPTTQSFTNALGQTAKTVVQNTNPQVTLTGGSVIPSGTSLMSDSVRLTMQADGNLVLSSLTTGKALWSTGTNGNNGAYAVFGTDGNLAVYTTAGTSKWTTGLTATTGAKLQLQNDANLVIKNSAGTSVWASSTSNQAPEADATSSYTYNPAGQLASVTDSAGNTWGYTYDLLGEPTKQTDPNTGTTTYDSYDDVGNLLQTTDARGQKLGYTYDWDSRPVAEYDLAKSATESGTNELAAWNYDSLAKGYPTSATRYVGGTTGSAYTQAVTGYNSAYQPLGSTETIPASDGFAAAGQSTAPTSGTVTYTQAASYDPTTGLLGSTTYQADGNLPAETVDYGYTQAGLLNGFGGTIGTNPANYLAQNVYDEFGHVLQANYQTLLSNKQVVTFGSYDPTTGRLTSTQTSLQGAPTPADTVHYRYNQAGEITAIDDIQNSTTHDTQCFSYDSMQRLTQAWSDTAGTTDPGVNDPTVGSVGSCTTSTPTTTATAPITTTTIGGPAPYWQSYSYDLLGDRTSMVKHSTTGNAANDTTQTIAYPGSDGTVTAALPNQATSITTSNPGLGTATLTPSYTDTATGKNAGNTVSRTATTSGEIVSGIKTTAGGALCLADPSGLTTDGTVQIQWGCGSSGQTYTTSTDGTVKISGKCLDTVGEATANSTQVDITTCVAGDTAQQWKATTGGTLVQVKSGRCLADPAANQAPATKQIIYDCGHGGQTFTLPATGTAVLAGTQQSFTYDAEGRTASVTTPTGNATSQTSKYLYDATGNLLEQTTATGTTDTTRILYLFGGAEQITQNVPNKSWTALRNYPSSLGTTITRTSAGTVAYQIANAQGTAETTIDASTLAVTRRYYDPYGNARGTQPSTWISTDENHGFLGQPADTSTGLNLLGARTYDPTQGRFLTPDPVFEVGDPNQMGGYTYAGDNPASSSDPSGLYDPDGGGTLDPRGKGVPDYDAGGDLDNVPGNVVTGAGHAVVGLADSIVSIGSAIGSAIVNLPANMINGLGIPGASMPTTTPDEHPIAHATGVNTNSTSYLFGEYGSYVPDGVAALVAVKDVVDVVQGVKAASKGKGILGALKKLTEKVAAKDDDPFTGKDPKPTDPSTPSKGVPAESNAKCSFDPTTPVLLADGKTKPIGKLKVGDKVESANPDTGKDEGGRTVQHVWINHDKDLLDVTVTTGGGKTSVIHTTANHPFWDETTHTWTRADQLKPHDHLASTHGKYPTVVATKATPGTADRWNLTVQQLHTYYVVAGGTPILVHNSNCGEIPYNSDDLSSAAYQARGKAGFPTGPYTRVPGPNVAVARVEGYDGLLTGFSKGDGYHSEDHIMDQIDALRANGHDIGGITHLYSERQPCSVCAGKLPDYLAENAQITWSVPWGDDGLMNSVSNEMLAGMIRRASGGR